jgi:putative transcriptional regulator
MRTSTKFGAALVESLQEAVAWSRGEIAHPVRNIPAMTADRVKAIRKGAAKSPREFSRRFGIPVRTLEGWEQGRRQPDPAASVLLRVIERNPKAVEDALA